MLAWAMTGFRPRSLKLLLAESPGKETSFVRPPLQVDDERAFELGLGEDHVGCLTVSRAYAATALRGA